MRSVKVSISLPEKDLAALDEYARAAGLRSRSAAVQQAIRLLRQPGLEDDYAAAWDEWEASGERAAWETTTADGLADAAR
jgi:Arc/MetJ-type ribon-helix-helix transcriptional regulator